MKKLLLLFSLFLFIFGCSQKQEGQSGKRVDSRKPMSWGHRQTIYVFADDNIWKYAEKSLRVTLERFQFTTENEPYFELKRATNIEQFYKFNNLLFLGDMQSNGEISTYIRDMIGSQIETELNENSMGMYPKENLWANDQYVLFLVGATERDLLILNLKMANKTFKLFQEKLFERISRQLYKTKIYSNEMFDSVPWLVKLPKSYVIYKKDSKNNFASFIARLRNKADRYISFYYEKIEKDNFNSDWLKKARADLAWKYYDEDIFNEKDIKLERCVINGKKGWKLSGRWQNKKYAIGGAFQSFAVYDHVSKTAFLIDNSVYFPEGYKLPSLIELEIISETFKIK